MTQTVPESAAMENANRAFPDRARVVVIGGGIVRRSVAYHLTKRGCATSSCSSADSSPRFSAELTAQVGAVSRG